MLIKTHKETDYLFHSKFMYLARALDGQQGLDQA